MELLQTDLVPTNDALSVMQRLYWRGRGCGQKSPIYPQMLIRRLTHPHSQIETSHGKLWHCGNYAVFRKVTVSFKMHWHREKVKANRFRINLKQNSLLFGPNFFGANGNISVPFWSDIAFAKCLVHLKHSQFPRSKTSTVYRYRFWALMDPDRGKSRQLNEHWFYLTTYVIVT